MTTSATAARVKDFVDDRFVGAERRDQGLDGEVVHRLQVAAAGRVDQRGGVVGEQGVGAPGAPEVVAQLAAGLLAGHGGMA